MSRKFVNSRYVVEIIRLDESDFGPSTPEECARWCGGKTCGVGDLGKKQWIEFVSWNGDLISANYGDYITRDRHGECRVFTPVQFANKFIEILGWRETTEEKETE